jgi:hypothetical protein
MELTDDQIDFIRKDVQMRGIKLNSLEDNIVDHICCIIEAHPGSDFNMVYAEVMNMFGEKGFLKIQEETVLLLNIKKEEKMKKTMYAIGFIATFMTTTGLLFKLQHWAGASIILVLGIMLINFGFLPMYFYDRYKRSVSG